MKRFYPIVISLVAGFMATAQAQTSIDLSKLKITKDLPIIERNLPYRHYAPHERQFKTPELREGTVLNPITCTGICDPDKAEVSTVQFRNEHDRAWEFSMPYDEETWEPMNTVVAEVPDGVYDVIARFSLRNGATAFVVRENVKVDASLTEMTFDIDEACNYIKFDSKLPDGTLTEAPLYIFLDEDPWVEIVPGTIEYFAADYYLCHGEYGVVGFGGVFGACYRLENGYTTDRGADVYINTVSDKYSLYQSRLVGTSDNLYSISLHPETLNHSTTVVNDIANYRKITEDFVHTPAAEEFGMVSSGFRLAPFSIYDGFWYSSVGVECTDPTIGVGTCFDESYLSYDGKGFNVLLRYDNIDVSRWETYVDDDFEETELVNYYVDSTPFVIKDGRQEYVNSNFSSLMYQSSSKLMLDCYPGEPCFGFTKDQMKIPFGLSAPVCMVENRTPIIDETNNIFCDYLYPYFYGRLGEDREVDNLCMTYTVSVDGEKVIESEKPGDSLAPWMYGLSMAAPQKSLVEIAFHDSNVMVDGLAGYNHTVVTRDWSKEDKWAPSLQLLMTRDTDGNVTDRFSTPSNGYILFAAGDFNYRSYINYRYQLCEYYEHGPVDVKVEYSPYGKDDWAEIPVAVESNNEEMPYYGTIFRSNLDSVDKRSDNFWYDVRISLTDDSGNNQVQTISPAFRIDSLDSIPSVNGDINETIPVYYNLQGVIVDNPVTGIYICRTGNTVSKVIIK